MALDRRRQQVLRDLEEHVRDGLHHRTRERRDLGLHLEKHGERVEDTFGHCSVLFCSVESAGGIHYMV